MAHRIMRWFSVVLLSVVSSLALANPLQIDLSHGNVDGIVTVQLTNTGSDTLSVLQWDTPFEAILSHDVFQVTSSTKALPYLDGAMYIGRHAKRAAPIDENFMTIKPGQSRTATVNLAEYYDIQKQNLYKVRFVGAFHYQTLSKKPSQLRDKNYSVRGISNHRNTISSLTHQHLISNEVSLAIAPPASTRIVPPAYNGCTANQQSYIQSATQSAELLTETAIADLQSLALDERDSSPRYNSWFGAYTEQRYDQVQSNFEAIGNALTNETIRFDCTCDEASVFAYVFPVRPYNIFLCQAFHAADELGTDSRAGTIIHELSHFTIVADTEDHVYSQQGAQSLASSDPDRAIENADSHEYFAENTPELPIRGDTTTPPTTQFTLLELDEPVSGGVSEGSAELFQVNDVQSVLLTSDTGNADLYIFSDAELTQLLCLSENTTATDQCELFNEETLYIVVFGASDAEFTLLATGQNTDPGEIVSTLEVGVTLSGSIAQDERVIYDVSGANLIELESVSGDADLYVFSSTNYIDTNLVCSSILDSSENTTDTCSLPSADSTYYVMVVGWLDSEYQLTASETEVDTTPEFVLTPFGNLPADQPVSRAIEQQAIHTYTASGVAAFELTSITGDADLLVFEGLIENNGVLICVSEEFSSDSILDRCDVSSSTSNLFEVAVFGYTASEYSLVGLSENGGTPTTPTDPTDPTTPTDPTDPTTPTDPADPTTPTDPTDPTTPTDPTQVTVSPPEDEPGGPVTTLNPSTPASANSSGGGSIGVICLITGVFMIGLRRRRLQAVLQ